MSIVCKQLVRNSDRVLSFFRPTMIMSPFNTASPSWNQKPSSNLPSIFREVEGDLFTAKRDTSMAHCVSSDMKMGAGIAVRFRLKFGRVDELLNQKKDVGQVAYLKDSQRFIFYLVTKKRFYDKPTENTLHASLLDMRDKCEKLGVTKLAMPRIGCGLDGLKWPLVFHLVQEVFQNCGMEITIYSFPDKKRKSMTPNLNRTQGDIRKFFEPKRPNSLPASAMNSKRKYHSDSSEEYLDTPKRRKIISHERNFLLDGEFDSGRVSFHGRNVADIEFDQRSPLKKKLSSDRRLETNLPINYKKAALDDTPAEALGNSPFLPSTSTKKRNSLPNPQLSYSFDSNQHEASMLPGIPILCEEDQDERNRMQQIPGSIYPYKISKRESKYSHNSDKFSTPIKEARRASFHSSDQDEEVSEEDSRHPLFKSDHGSSSPYKKIIEVKTPSKSSRKEKRRSSTKSHSEEKVTKEKRRSSSKSRSEEKCREDSEEKVKKEKRRSSSKSRSEEKCREAKRRSSSKNSAEEKDRKEKRRSTSKSCSEEKCEKDKRRSSSQSEEKLKKRKRRSADSVVRQPLGNCESSQTKVSLVSERFPSFNKKRLPRDLSSSSDESVVINPSCLNNIYQGEDIIHPQCKLSLDHTRGDEDTMLKTKRKRLASPKQVYSTGQSHWAAKSVDETFDETNVTGIDLPSNEPRGRLGEIAKIKHRIVDDSLDRKVKKPPIDESFGTPRKSPRKALKSPIGKMYCDKEADHVSVKARLSLDHKL